MPDSVEIYIQKALKGLCLDGYEAEICDFSLEEQNAALESQGIAPIVSSTYKPILGDTVTYIVAAVLINEKNEVLMMQEAKQSCAGKWYLPAGRVEKGENLCEAAVREVKEETGLIVECTSLVLVEVADGSWIRFVLTGIVIGGTLKTPAQADSESLQAKWISDLSELSLRASDITHVVDRTRAYVAAKKAQDKTWHQDQLPALKPYDKILLRLVIMIKKRSTNRMHVLLSERTAFHLPTCELHPAKSLHSTLRRFMVDIFGAEVAPHKPYGLLSVEHDPKTGKDGVCLTLLVAFRNPLEEVPIIGKCVWHEVSKSLGDKLMNRTSGRNSTIPVHVIR